MTIISMRTLSMISAITAYPTMFDVTRSTFFYKMKYSRNIWIERCAHA